MGAWRRRYAALFLGAAVYAGGVTWATSAEQALRRHPPGPVPSLSSAFLVDAIASAQRVVREEMPWRRDADIAQPELLARLLFVAFGGGGPEEMRASVRALPEWQAYQRDAAPPPAPPPSTPGDGVAGRIRVERQRFRNDRGWWRWRGMTLFDGIHLARTGHEAELVRRLDLASAARVSVVRVLGMAAVRVEQGQTVGLFTLHPDQPGYWEAAARVIALANARGIYVHLVIFADAQVAMPDAARRGDLVRAWPRRFDRHPGLVFELANEARKNGWHAADDAELLLLADALASELGHRDFMISDPLDGETEAQTRETLAEFRALAKHSNILSWHGSRTEASDGRWRRWVDHQKLAAEIVADVARVNPQAALVNTEPMGSACAREPGRRDDVGDAFVAGAAVAAVTGTGWTHHYIAAQSDCTPGLIDSAVTLQLPASPEFRFVNDSTGDAPSRGFTGADKVRWMTDGRAAYGVAYGADVSRLVITWANGFRPVTELWRGARVVLLHAER